MSGEDERMDRARRIREMREGQRDAAGDGDDGAESADPEPSAEPTEAEPETPADDDTDASEADGDSTESGDDGAADEAAALAERAAAAAADLSGQEDAAAVAEQAAAEVVGGTDASAPVMQGATGVELPDQAAIEDAMDEAAAAGLDEGPTTAAPGIEAEETTTEERTRVLEFALGDATYCIDIEYVEEIVERETITRVPNTPAYVTGVVDLRGQITTILDPKTLLAVDQTGPEQIIVVFDPEAFEDQGAIGWLVDEVRQVDPILESEVNDPPVDDEYVNGVVDRDGELVIWISPDTALRTALGDD